MTQEFKGSIGSYKLVQTEDNSQTFWSEKFDENCHSTAGAIAETDYTYINGAFKPALEHFQTSPINLLDVGFGMGIGLMRTLDHLKNKKLNYYSIEVDYLFALNSAKNLVKKYNLKLNDNEKCLELHGENLQAKIFIGDGTIRLKEESIQKLHCIYQDAFSPKKNPELWTVDWFKHIASLSHDSAILTTYSASHSVRENLKEAGFIVETRKGFGHKRSQTYATLKL